MCTKCNRGARMRIWVEKSSIGSRYHAVLPCLCIIIYFCQFFPELSARGPYPKLKSRFLTNFSVISKFFLPQSAEEYRQSKEELEAEEVSLTDLP